MAEPIHVASLGAGVQSSTAVLRAALGEITPMPVGAIFADTQAEPKSVYIWLDWLEKQLPFPVYRVSAGNLREDELRIRKSKRTGLRYLKNSIPAFVLNRFTGSHGLLGRKCTSDYKIVPIQRKIRELVGIKRAGRGIIYAKLWIGISVDEAHRMKPSRVDYIENIFPLIDAGMSRKDCLKWMSKKGYPTPPRSACSFCPFHSDEEWQRLKTEEPEEFESVVDFERKLIIASNNQDTLRGTPYLHSSCQPIDTVDFLKNKPGYEQISLFGNECEGLCGV